MKRWLKIVLMCFGAVLLVGIVAFGWYFSQAAPIGTGFVAKYLCSSTFMSKREPGIVFKEDVTPVNLRPVKNSRMPYKIQVSRSD